MQIKVADLELRSRWNNIRIYGIPNGAKPSLPFTVKMKKILKTLEHILLNFGKPKAATTPKGDRKTQDI